MLLFVCSTNVVGREKSTLFVFRIICWTHCIWSISYWLKSYDVRHTPNLECTSIFEGVEGVHFCATGASLGVHSMWFMFSTLEYRYRFCIPLIPQRMCIWGVAEYALLDAPHTPWNSIRICSGIEECEFSLFRSATFRSALC